MFKVPDVGSHCKNCDRFEIWHGMAICTFYEEEVINENNVCEHYEKGYLLKDDNE